MADPADPVRLIARLDVMIMPVNNTSSTQRG